jgi:SAM-dependent methyltransferase
VRRSWRRKVERADAGADRGERYRSYVSQQLGSGVGEDTAMRQAVGGEFEAMGLMLRDLLIHNGLQASSAVVDVGCGSGRLALPLASYLDERGSYLGTDVVPGLLEYAARLVGRPDWRFEVVDDLTIPAPDASADVVCFFSVLTHLRHEHSYLYLREARRVVKPTGRIVFSFLDVTVPPHWHVFMHNVNDPFSDRPLDQFISRDAIETFAHHLELQVISIDAGDQPHIPLRQPVTLDNGTAYTDLGRLGQSVAVLAHRPGEL